MIPLRKSIVCLASCLVGLAACDPLPAERDPRWLEPPHADAGVAPDAARDAAAPDRGQPWVDAGTVLDAADPGTWVRVCDVSEDLNMRSGPGTSYEVITTLPLGALAEQLAVDGDWQQLRYEGLTGWCHGKYLCPADPPGGPASADGGGGGPPGASIGTLWNTYYFLAEESAYGGSKDTVLYDAACQPLATVSASYSDAVCIEGSGKLADGRVINYAKTCACGRACPTGGTICYVVLDAQFPWGAGAMSNPLEPLRSIAVDKTQIALGSTVYLELFDGVAIPAVAGQGGYVHDGCFRADDIGGAIKGSHIDIFAGSQAMMNALESVFPTKTNFAAFEGGGRCTHLR